MSKEKEGAMVRMQPLIIQYANLLHEYRDPNAGPVKEFLKRNSDPVLRRRAKVLNKLFRLKQSLVTS
jgi:hypothetical protein